MSGPIFCFDFTLSSSQESDKDILISKLRALGEKWCVQLEKGEKTGYEHYQGRIKLHVKKRLTTLKKDLGYDSIHLSPTSTANSKNMFYVMKEDSRIDGPWSNCESDMSEKMPWQLEDIKDLYPFQQVIWDSAVEHQKRFINVLVNESGAIGKSSVVHLMSFKKRGIIVPFCNDYQDLLAMIADAPKYGCYLIDMPRAINKERLYQLYSAIETIKDGYAYDKRYKFRYCHFDSPTIWVFTNSVPDLNLLTRDRWILWKVDEHKNLIPYFESKSSTCEYENNIEQDPFDVPIPEEHIGTKKDDINIIPTEIIIDDLFF